MHQVASRDIWRGALLGEALRRANEGETIVVTRYRKPYALILPLSAAPTITEEMLSTYPPLPPAKSANPLDDPPTYEPPGA